MVERAYVDKDKKKGVSRVRFSRNAFAQEILADVKDGIMQYLWDTGLRRWKNAIASL